MPSVTVDGGKMEVTLYKPHPKQRFLHQDGTRFKVLNWGRRTGKSTFAINACLKGAFEIKGRYWIVSPTYQMSKNIYWRDLAVTLIPKELIAKKNETELIITLINGSTIELKGSDNEDSLRGAGIKGLVLDEYAFQKPTAWDLVLRPMLADSGGWAIFISTPNGFNHFFDVAERSKAGANWLYSHATTFDNPYIERDEIESIRQDLIAAEGDDGDIRFKQEYLAEFKKKTGLVYKAFSRETHIVKPEAIPVQGTNLMGIDFGFTNPLAAIFIRVDYDNNWYIYDELYRSGLTTEQATTIIKQKMTGTSFTNIIGDSAAAQAIEDFKSYGVMVTPVEKEKDSIMSGIRAVQDMLKIQEGTGKPKLFVSSACSNLIWEFESYSYPEKKDAHNPSEEPVKENDHALDALRYVALTVKKPSKAKVFVPQHILNQRGKV